MTLRISWSALRTHEVCKQRSFLKRGKHLAPAANQRVFFPGTVTDRVTRDWLTHDPSPGRMPGMVEAIMDREWQQIRDDGGAIAWKTPADRAQVLADCREAVTKIEPVLLKLVVPYDYDADVSFSIPVRLPHPAGGAEEILLIGFMDIMVHDDQGRFWIWDVKHTRDNGYWRKVEGQLTFYDLACFLMNGQGTERVGLLQPLCDVPVKPFAVSLEARTQMLARIAGMAHDIWVEDHTPRSDSVECGFCDYKHACSKFTPIVIGGKHRVAF